MSDVDPDKNRTGYLQNTTHFITM